MKPANFDEGLQTWREKELIITLNAHLFGSRHESIPTDDEVGRAKSILEKSMADLFNYLSATRRDTHKLPFEMSETVFSHVSSITTVLTGFGTPAKTELIDGNMFATLESENSGITAAIFGITGENPQERLLQIVCRTGSDVYRLDLKLENGEFAPEYFLPERK